MARTSGTSGIEPHNVVSIEVTKDDGYWAPLTNEGTLLVDGFLASCYAGYPHTISDMAMSSIKKFPSVFLDTEESQHKDGTRSIIEVMKQHADKAGLKRKNTGGEETLELPCCDKNIDVTALDVLIHKMEL